MSRLVDLKSTDLSLVFKLADQAAADQVGDNCSVLPAPPVGLVFIRRGAWGEGVPHGEV